MRKPGGYAQIVGPDPTIVYFDGFRCEQIAPTHEVDTFTCCHCNRVVHVKTKAPMDEVGSMCRNCMKMVCPACVDGPCVPFMKKIEEDEQKAYLRNQYKMVMGL